MLFNPSLGMSSSIRELACSVSDSGKLLRIKTMRFSPSSQTVGFLPVTRRGQSAAAAPPLQVLEEVRDVLLGDLLVVAGAHLPEDMLGVDLLGLAGLLAG